MKTLTATLLFTLLLGLTACAAAPIETTNPTATATGTAEMPLITSTTIPTGTPAPTLTSTLKPKPVFSTTIGDLVIEEARWVDEVNGVKAGPDERILLILIGKPGQAPLKPSNFTLDGFDKALRDQSKGEVHISDDAGLYSVCSMAGWIGNHQEEFGFGFRIPKTAKTIQLNWPGNEPIDLSPVG